MRSVTLASETCRNRIPQEIAVSKRETNIRALPAGVEGESARLAAIARTALEAIPVPECGLSSWCGMSCQRPWQASDDPNPLDGTYSYVKRAHAVEWQFEGEPLVIVSMTEYAHADGTRHYDRAGLDIPFGFVESYDEAAVLARVVPEQRR